MAAVLVGLIEVVVEELLVELVIGFVDLSTNEKLHEVKVVLVLLLYVLYTEVLAVWYEGGAESLFEFVFAGFVSLVAVGLAAFSLVLSGVMVEVLAQSESLVLSKKQFENVVLL